MTLRPGFEPKSLTQFCALSYRGQQSDQFSVAGSIVILILIYSEGAGVRLLVSPDWRQIVDPADQAYVAEILSDFRERAQSVPEALLEQVSSLSTGPLVTHTCGIRLEEYPELHARSLAFAELEG